jgi:hypothetical protein
MTNITSPLGSLTLTTKPAASIVPGTDVLAGIDGRQTSRDFDPGQYVGYYNASGPQVGDAANMWLPTVYGVSTYAADNNGIPVVGAVRFSLAVPPGMVKFYTSPLVFTLSATDLVVVATGTF